VRSVDAGVGRLLIKVDRSKWEIYAARVEERGKVLHLVDQKLGGPYLKRLLRRSQINNELDASEPLLRQLAGDLELSLENVLSIPINQTLEKGSEAAQGIFEVFNKPGGFVEEDLAFLQIISAQIFSLIMRRRLIDEKERSKSLAAIGQLASTIIHDLKNPISAIIGCSELLDARATMSEQQIDRLSTIIRNQANRCITMVEELLSVARGEKRFRFEVVSLNEVLNEIAMMLETETERRKVALTTKFEYQGKVRVDRAKLMRVIFNLTNNALEILKEGGVIALETRALDETWIEIVITDNGPGVPTEVSKQLFTPFATFGKAKGTGLGLYISREIIRDHGGVIDLDPTYKAGARFRIKLKQEV
jgi:signal transduction histidine kinase